MNDGFDRRLIAPLIAGAVLNPINTTIISVALVPIGSAFGEPPSATAWLISALYIATAIGQPVAGRLIDVHGPRRLFLPATALVGIAGVIGTLAPSLTVLVVARVILGLGTCAGYPAAMRLIRDQAERTGKDNPAGVLTVLAISTQTVAVIGPPLGGLLIELGGWRTTLAINVPLAATAFVLGLRRFPADRPLRRTGGHEPLIDLRVLGNVPLLVTYVRALLAYVVSYSFIYGFTQWLEDGRGLSAGHAGLVTLPMFGTAIVVSALTGRRQQLRGKLVVAAVGQVVASVLLLTLGPSSPVVSLVLVVLVFGIPQGLNSLALQNAVYRQADPDSIGASAGLLRTFGYLGAIVSAVAQGGFYGDRADTAGLHELGWFLVATSVAFLLVNLLDPTLTARADRTDGGSA